MEIYIEYVLLDNFFIDALIMFLSLKVLKMPISKLGLVLSSVFGAGFAVISPMITLSGILLILLKFLVAFVMCIMANFSFIKILPRFCLFVGFTFLFGGALIGVCQFMGVQTYDYINLAYVYNLPIGTVIAGVIILFLISLRLIIYLARRKKFESTLDIEIIIQNKSAILRGFVDTGNTLINKCGRPVVVIAEKELSKWFNVYERTAIAVNKPKLAGLEKIDFLNVSSLGGSYKMPIFEARAKINNKVTDICVGITNNKIMLDNCQAIIGANLMEVANA